MPLSPPSIRCAKRKVPASKKSTRRELSWLDYVEKTVETIPEIESEFMGEMMIRVNTTKFVLVDCDL